MGWRFFNLDFFGRLCHGLETSRLLARPQLPPPGHACLQPVNHFHHNAHDDHHQNGGKQIKAFFLVNEKHNKNSYDKKTIMTMKITMTSKRQKPKQQQNTQRQQKQQ